MAGTHSKRYTHKDKGELNTREVNKVLSKFYAAQELRAVLSRQQIRPQP
jgi:hypothetical protein